MTDRSQLGAEDVLWLDPDEDDQAKEFSAEATQCHELHGAFMYAGTNHP